MSESHYSFGEDTRNEAARLAAVEEAFDGQSQAALREVGVGTGCGCWEVGAGRGSIARWLADRVGRDGYVLATDLEDTWFDRDIAGVEFAQHDVSADPVPGRGFDLVHARFVLEHLTQPRAVVGRLASALRPGGVLVLEDSAGLQLNVTPTKPNIDRLTSAWERAGRTLGWAPNYGVRLMRDLRAAGLVDLRGREYRQLAAGGDAWRHVVDGIKRLRDALVQQRVSDQEVGCLLTWLADPENIITGPPVTIAWGRDDPD
jgi:SAM-dependent methyltransferase